MADLRVRRWRRYGHDRLYLETAGGQRVGYHDLTTGQTHLDYPGLRDEVQALLADYLARMQADQQSAAAPLDGAVPVTDTANAVDWIDLAVNQPGAAARDRALSERDAAPIRTRLARLLRVHTAERAWRIGAAGEVAVAARLTKLGAGWRVLHAIPVGERGSDIDHLVIGPGGVFTINTKHHPHARIWVGGDTIMVNGTSLPYVRNSRYEARRASRLLSAAAGTPVAVTGIIAFTGRVRSLTIRHQPTDHAVLIVPRKQLAHRLRIRATVLSEDQVAAIYGVARRSTTWIGNGAGRQF